MNSRRELRASIPLLATKPKQSSERLWPRKQSPRLADLEIEISTANLADAGTGAQMLECIGPQ